MGLQTLWIKCRNGTDGAGAEENCFTNPSSFILVYMFDILLCSVFETPRHVLQTYFICHGVRWSMMDMDIDWRFEGCRIYSVLYRYEGAEREGDEKTPEKESEMVS